MSNVILFFTLTLLSTTIGSGLMMAWTHSAWSASQKPWFEKWGFSIGLFFHMMIPVILVGCYRAVITEDWMLVAWFAIEMAPQLAFHLLFAKLRKIGPPKVVVGRIQGPEESAYRESRIETASFAGGIRCRLHVWFWQRWPWLFDQDAPTKELSK